MCVRCALCAVRVRVACMADRSRPRPPASPCASLCCVVSPQLVDTTTTLYERRNRLRHDERLKLEQAKRYQRAQEVKRGLDLQLRAKQVEKELERQKDRAYAAQVAQDAIQAEAAIAQRDVARIEQQLAHREELEQQLELRKSLKRRGVDAVGNGVTDLEWALNAGMRNVRAAAPP